MFSFLFKKYTLFFITFIIAFTVRLYFIKTTPQQDAWIDLHIYQDGGQLITKGINPYDYSDGIEIRNQLRTDSIAYNEWVSEDQSRWDFYASSNLPLSIFYYGAIELIFGGSSTAYRIVFAFIDSILAAFIALLIFSLWGLKKSLLNYLLTLGIGALSPVLILWGAVFPEDKGMQILLMLLAIYHAKDKRWILSAVFLGFSVAFKGLGIFILPICLFLIIDSPEKLFKIKMSQIKKMVAYCSICFLSGFIWFIPFLSGIMDMAKARIEMNMGVGAIPGHGSIWLLVMGWFPNHWEMIKNITLFSIIALWGFMFIYKKLNITALSLLILVIFVDVLLLQGSMDRMNIGLLISLVFFGLLNVNYAKLLGWYTIFAGVFFYKQLIEYRMLNESIDAKYLMGYLILFLLYPLYQYFIDKRARQHLE